MSQLKRVNFFTGRLLSASDLQAEQEYNRAINRRHNRFLHGSGVVQGLKVSVENRDEGSAIVVEPGFALAPNGEEIDLQTRMEMVIPDAQSPLLVCIRYFERFTDAVPASGDESAQSAAW